MNVLVRGLLRTPGLCRIIGNQLVTIYVVGRKSGRRYPVPEADVVGKPAAAFFAAALAHLDADPAHTMMIGDDIETDVLAAQQHGLTGVLVKTGKYLPRTHHHASGTPHHVLDSFADLPALLEQLT